MLYLAAYVFLLRVPSEVCAFSAPPHPSFHKCGASVSVQGLPITRGCNGYASNAQAAIFLEGDSCMSLV